MAPFLSRQRTTSTCPALAAMWRAVSPRWRSESTDSSDTPHLRLYRDSAVEETHDVADVGRSSALQQQQHDVQVAHEGCHVDRGQAGLGGEHSVSVPGVAGEGVCGWMWVGPHLCDGLDGSSVSDQQLHHLHPVLLAGDVEWREAVLRGQEGQGDR